MAQLIKASGEVLDISPENGTDFTLEEAQKYVGGYVECIRLDNKTIMLVNEEGFLLNLPFNERAAQIYSLSLGGWIETRISGDAIICDTSQFR